MNKLFDKHKTEIKSGDILQGANSVIYSVSNLDGTLRAKVEAYFMGDKSGCAKSDWPSDMNLSEFDLVSIEIIGNIHENPELL